MFATAIPVSVNAVNGLVNQSTTVPPAVSVSWSGAVHPAAVFLTSVCTPAPRLVHASRSTEAVDTADAVSVRYSVDPVLNPNLTSEAPELADHTDPV